MELLTSSYLSHTAVKSKFFGSSGRLLAQGVPLEALLTEYSDKDYTSDKEYHNDKDSGSRNEVCNEVESGESTQESGQPESFCIADAFMPQDDLEWQALVENLDDHVADDHDFLSTNATKSCASSVNLCNLSYSSDDNLSISLVRVLRLVSDVHSLPAATSLRESLKEALLAGSSIPELCSSFNGLVFGYLKAKHLSIIITFCFMSGTHTRTHARKIPSLFGPSRRSQSIRWQEARRDQNPAIASMKG